ncbi:MAG: CapA family protein [Acidobacteria bacterium]|nr:CapA family protein [Acidobacteriota bacterium]
MTRPHFTAALLVLALAGCSRKPKPPPAPPPPPLTRLLVGGDVMLSRYVGRLARRSGDAALPFRAIASTLSAADIAFVNLESPFSDRGRPADKGMLFKAEPAMVQGLVLAGIDVVSTANNHARDQGAYGLEYTLRWLDRHGIRAVGTGADAVLERNGLRFGFLAYTYDQANGNYPDQDRRVAMLDVPVMRADVKRMCERAGVVIVSMHAGREYSPRPDSQQVEFARAAIDAGASVVAGHHPHVAQPAERYRDGVIFYSLGNLVFDQFQSPETQQGLLGEVAFRGRRIESYRTVPIRLKNTAPHLR